MASRILVTGAGGFIGHHLVKTLSDGGHYVRGVDLKHPEFDETAADEFSISDLRDRNACLRAVDGIDQIYHLASDMGGIGYITSTHASIAANNTSMNINILEAARLHDVKRLLFSSSACVYPQHLQESPKVTALQEDDAYPADPEEGYGWEKLYGEKLFEYYHDDYGLETRIVRFHNVYGPLGTYEGGKEKAPAALCRKVAMAKDGGTIEVWGDGKQTRSFMYIDDCIDGIRRLMRSDYSRPLNLGTEQLITINDFVDLIADVAGKSIGKGHNLNKPQGVRGRNSDNSQLRKVLDWEPQVSLREGIRTTYEWIENELAQQGRTPNAHIQTVSGE